MTRVKISIAIILSIIITGLFSEMYIYRNCGKLISTAEKISHSVNDNSDYDTEELCTEMQTEWRKFEKTASMFTEQTKLSEIKRMIAVISATDDNPADIQPLISELICTLDTLRYSVMTCPVIFSEFFSKNA